MNRKKRTADSEKNIDLRKTLRGRLPHVPFGDIANRILGSSYELSLVICGDSLARKINKKYRKKDYAPNVLSFPLGKHEGEIFLNVRKAGREARAEGSTPHKRVAFLFIHGCLHLKGLDHGRKMDRLEATHMKKTGF